MIVRYQFYAKARSFKDASQPLLVIEIIERDQHTAIKFSFLCKEVGNICYNIQCMPDFFSR